MKKTVLKFGLASGILVCLFMIISFILLADSQYAISEVFGFSGIILSMSLVFFGIREHKIKNLGGSITFKQAFLAGLYMVIICSLMYTIAWLIISYSDPLMVENLMEGYLNPEDLKTPEKIAEMTKIMEEYNNPFYRSLFTLREIFPLGVVLNLIFAAVLTFFPRKKAV
ncbi:MAG: hypothetical protein COA58_15555 [Bacteroidetes bacterium]|nr:MAG: hypothetical protein COA58_15555 [Bacteroidota bacterium]